MKNNEKQCEFMSHGKKPSDIEKRWFWPIFYSDSDLFPITPFSLSFQALSCVNWKKFIVKTVQREIYVHKAMKVCISMWSGVSLLTHLPTHHKTVIENWESESNPKISKLCPKPSECLMSERKVSGDLTYCLHMTKCLAFAFFLSFSSFSAQFFGALRSPDDPFSSSFLCWVLFLNIPLNVHSFVVFSNFSLFFGRKTIIGPLS